MLYDEFMAIPFKQYGYTQISHEPTGNIELINLNKKFIKKYKHGSTIEIIADISRERDVTAYRSIRYTIIHNVDMRRAILFTNPADVKETRRLGKA